MKVPLTMKWELIGVTQSQGQAFKRETNQYTKACNYDSNIYENHNQDIKANLFHRLTYHPTENKFGLKSLMAESARRTVKARYNAVDSQMKQRRYNFPDVYTYYCDKYYWKHGRYYCVPQYAKWHHCYKDGKWIWHRIHFHRPQIDLVYKYDWSLDLKHHLISINTLGKRTKVHYFIPKYFKKYLKMSHKLGTAKLLRNAGGWWFYVSITVNVNSLNKLNQAHNVVGSDRGQRFIGYTYDKNKHSICFRGLPHRKKRKHFLKVRRTLQHKGTRSAKRKLKSIRQRENNYMNDVNHRYSKILALNVGKKGVLGLENLRGIRFTTENASKKHRSTMVSWAFYGFGKKCETKVHFLGGRFMHVPAKYTSQRNPFTGRIMKLGRNHNTHTYTCWAGKYDRKGHKVMYKTNDDRLGGINIQFLTELKCLGYHNPTIQSDGRIKYYILYKKRSSEKRWHYKTKYLGRLQAIKIYKARKNREQLRSISPTLRLHVNSDP